MCAVVSIFVMVIVLALASRVREEKVASTVLAAIGLYPVGVLFLWMTFGAHESASISEALPFYLLFSLALGVPIALVLGSFVRPFFKPKTGYGRFAFAGCLMGAGIAPYHFLVSTSPWTGRESLSPGIYVLVDMVLMGLFFPWLMVNLFEENRLLTVWKGSMVVSLAFVGLGIYIVPNVAFRTYGLYAPLGSLERIGARRALMFGGPEGQKATMALAHAGDQLMLEKLRRELIEGHYDASGLSGTEIVVEQMSGDPEVRQALINQLDAALKTLHVTGSFGDEESKVVSLCERLGKTGDVRAVPSLIRVYRIPTQFVNFREAAATAIARIGGPEAAKFASEELARLHPNLDRHLGELLGKMNDPQVKEAYAAFVERGKAWQKSQQMKDVPVESLAQAGDKDALLTRALDPKGKDREKAAIALIKSGHPMRVKAALAALTDLVGHGKDLRTFDDPELFKALVAKVDFKSKLPDLRIPLFLAEWAPPGSEKVLEKFLFRYNLQQAADGLGRLGTTEAAKILMRRLAKVTPIDGSFELYLIRGLGMTKQPIAEKTLLAYLEKKYDRAPLVSDGSPIYPNDVAARALKELATPKALSGIVDYRYQGDPVAIETWWGRD